MAIQLILDVGPGSYTRFTKVFIKLLLSGKYIHGHVDVIIYAVKVANGEKQCP